MLSFIRKRSVASLISLIGLIVMVFFLSRLTGTRPHCFCRWKLRRS